MVFLVEFFGDVRAILGVRGVCVGWLANGFVGFDGLAVNLRFFVGEIGQPFGVVGVEALLGDKALCRQEKNTNEENGAQNEHYIGGSWLVAILRQVETTNFFSKKLKIWSRCMFSLVTILQQAHTLVAILRQVTVNLHLSQ